MHKRKTIWEVRVLHLKQKVSVFAKQRKDEWGEEVFKQVNRALCPTAGDVIMKCDAHFFFLFFKTSSWKISRPRDEHIDSAFAKLCRYIKRNDNLHDLMKILKENCQNIHLQQSKHWKLVQWTHMKSCSSKWRKDQQWFASEAPDHSWSIPGKNREGEKWEGRKLQHCILLELSRLSSCYKTLWRM